MNRSALSPRVASPNPRQTTSPRVLPWIAALLTMTFWASSFVVIRDAGEFFSPGPMALLRGASAAVVLSVWMLFRRPDSPPARSSG
ncbi:EamA family transporter [Brevibacterium iodinum]|uniref:EamA family transporter n=1 Tax=Brevibacterium iodinum TaxID=31943 RepID=UPI001FC96DD0|nr:EamA family transporter [Brevibacterium iodinum]